MGKQTGNGKGKQSNGNTAYMYNNITAWIAHKTGQ